MKNKDKNNEIILENLQPFHAQYLFELLQDDRIYTYIPEKPPESLESLTKRYKMLNEGSLNKKEIWLNYAIYLPREKEYIGTLQGTVQLDKNIITIAYILNPKQWGKGYAKKALKIMFCKLEKQFVGFSFSAYIDTRNERSIKLVKGLNFKCVEHIKNADFFKGHSSDEFVFFRDNISIDR